MTRFPKNCDGLNNLGKQVNANSFSRVKQSLTNFPKGHWQETHTYEREQCGAKETCGNVSC